MIEAAAHNAVGMAINRGPSVSQKGIHSDGKATQATPIHGMTKNKAHIP